MEFTKGNLFDSNSEALVNTVNTMGVMGKGVALQFKERYPMNYNLYKSACKRGEVKIGEMFITATNSMMDPKWIINFPTKQHWMHSSSYTYIEKGLNDLVKQIESLGIQSIAIPPLGTGQGGLQWDRVKLIIEEKLSHLKIDIKVFEPIEGVKSTSKELMTKLTKPRAMILSVISQYMKLGYDISFLEIQKLAYFLQRMGQEDLKLNYVKYQYGPYAHNLQHLLNELEKGYIVSEKSVMDSKPLDLVFLNLQNMAAITQFVENECSEEEKNRLKRLFSLMAGYESPFGLELLATVDWILNSNNNIYLSEPEIKDRIKIWSKRKDDNFNLDHVRLAQKRLIDFKYDLSNA